MEAVYSPETWVSTFKSTWRHSPEQQHWLKVQISACEGVQSRSKVKLTRYAMQTPRERGNITPNHSYLGTRWEWSASRPVHALPPRKGSPVPTVQKAGRASELVWTQRLEKKYFASAGDRTPVVPNTILTKLPQLPGVQSTLTKGLKYS
jgi:hypothetical protein